jgi:hypothetical protein
VLAVDTGGQTLFSNHIFKEIFGEHSGEEPELLGSSEVLDEGGEKLPTASTPSSRAAGGESFTARFAVAGEHGTLRRFDVRGQAIEADGITGGVLIIREVADDPS